MGEESLEGAGEKETRQRYKSSRRSGSGDRRRSESASPDITRLLVTSQHRLTPRSPPRSASA
eukprot:2610953-Karenia_brevis.AAC.1